MSERDKRFYDKLKADPVRYAAYLERKRQERKARPGYEAKRRREWRNANPESAKRIRQANHAVEAALKSGKLFRPNVCSDCGDVATNIHGEPVLKIEAHHHKGYAREHWLDIVWLCVFCHRKADRKAA